jgi:signal transduction histidine kinase
LKRSFERFHRSRNVRSTTIEGSGVGLSICSEIVEFHNGTIKAFGENDMFTIKIIL